MKIHTQRQLGEGSSQLKVFVEKAFSKHKDLEQNFLLSMSSKMNKGIYSIDNENGITVAASIHESSWHPHCIYVSLAYELNRPDLDSIQLMVDELEVQFDKPLFFLIDDRFEYLDKALLKRGARFIRKTEVITIQPQQSELVTIEHKVKPLSEVSNDPNLMTSLLNLCKKTYTETHSDNPVGDFPLSRWESVIMKDLKKENSYVALNENKVIAFSLMYQVEEDYWELGWIGVESQSEMNLLDSRIHS